jgi:lysyl-tRNA synthetase class 2
MLTIANRLISNLVHHVTGGYITKFHTQHGEEYEVNWQAPWRRVEMIPALEEACGEKFPSGVELHSEEAGNFLKALLKKMNVECTPPLTNARMLDKLVGEFIVRSIVLKFYGTY